MLPPSARARTPLRAFALAIALALTATLTVSPPARADDPDELRRQLSREEQREAELTERVVRTERELERTRAELATLQERLREVTDRLVAAQEREERALEDAELARGQAEHAQQQLADSEDELADNTDQLGDLARDTYKYGAPRSSVVSIVGNVTLDGNPGQFSDAVQYLNRGVGSWSLLVEQAEALLTRVDAAATRAEEERQNREALLDEASAARDEVAEAHAEAQQLVGDASLQQQRQQELVEELEQAKAEAAVRIGDLEDRIEAEERRRAEEEARRRAEEEARRRAEEEARQRAAEERRAEEARAQRRAEEEAAAERRRRQNASSSASSSRSSSSSSSSTRSSSSSSSSSSSPTSSSSSSAPRASVQNHGNGLVTVGGITVASSLGPGLQRLLDDARADGIVLGGHGWRSIESQVALRQANGCRDVYTSPPSSCRIPTAIPGHSEHEKGLAIDFTWQGRTICYPSRSANCHGNAAFDWLKANAHRYGLRNLPSEAWHWSTTGR